MSIFYNEIATEGSYNNYIQKFWVLDNSLSPFSSSRQYALPNGCCTIAFVSGNGANLGYKDNMLDLSAGIYLSGQITSRVGVSLKPHAKAIMAQLKPWLLPMITDVPMIEFVDKAISLEYVNYDLYRNLFEIELANESLVIKRFYKAINRYLDTNADCFFIKWFFNNLYKAPLDRSSIADIAYASGFTQRRVEQKFKTLVGPSAKEMQRILQIRQLIDDMQKPQNHNNLSVLAHRHGYHDQSHFIKSYRHINFESPSQFNRDNYLLPFSGHFDFLQS